MRMIDFMDCEKGKLHPAIWLKQESGMDNPPEAVEDIEPDHGRGGPKLVCAVCGGLITWERAAIEVGGKHEHVFSNPHGYVYAVRCFSQAVNVIEATVPSSEFSWFPGHKWSLGVCSACETHLGWHFSSSTDSGFYGFIRQRLVLEEDE